MSTKAAYSRHAGLTAFLPVLVGRVLAGNFTSQAEIARCYGVDKTSVRYWRSRAEKAGLVSAYDWERGLAEGRLAPLSGHDIAA